MKYTQHTMPLALCTLLASACSFDMSEHPSACKLDSDCGKGAYCFEQFCVDGSSTTVDGGSGSGHAGSTAGTSGSGGGGGTGGTLGHSGSMAWTDGSVQPSDGGNGDAAVGGNDVDGSTSNDGSVPVVKAPYAACAIDADCKTGETCRVTDGKGVCGLPCSSVNDCSDPTGGTAVKSCGQDGRCKLNCSAKVGGGPPTPRTCPSGMVCITEVSDPSWLPSEQTCYPN